MASLEDLTPEARDELALLARELSENPATREPFLRLTKQARPSLTIDTIDIKDQVSQVVQQAEDRVMQLENKLRVWRDCPPLLSFSNHLADLP